MQNERFIVNGSHDATKLQDLLDGFIRKYVLCPECDNPETDLLVATKKGTISQGCKACGFHGPLEVHHKVNTYIIKNPPSTNPGVIGSSLTEGKRSKRSKKGENGDSANNSSANLASESDLTSSSTLDVVVPKAVVEEEDDTTWSTDLSEEAVRARMADLTEGAKTMTISDDAEKSEKDRIDIFYNLVKLRRDGNELENVQVHKELAVEADRLDITFKAPLVLAELLFSHNIINEIRKHRNLLLRFTHNSIKAQRYLLGGIEQIIALHAEKLLEKVCKFENTQCWLTILIAIHAGGRCAQVVLRQRHSRGEDFAGVGRQGKQEVRVQGVVGENP